MNDSERRSRVNKYEKRRKNTKSISILIVVAGVLVVFLLGIWMFGDDDKKKTVDSDGKSSAIVIKEDDSNNKDNNADKNNNVDGNEEPDGDQDTETGTDTPDNQNVEKEPVTSSDENVIEAYKADWQPIGTEQEGPHTVQFNKSSQDWKEMQKAASLATGVDLETMNTLWIGNGGDQKVIATISDADNSNIYRVYLSWVDNEGWKPTQVEVLKEFKKN